MRTITGVLVLACACSATPSADDDGTGGSPTGDDAASGADDGLTATSADDDDADDDDASDAADTAATTGSDDASTGEPEPPPPTCGALANVPSEPGPHVAEIEALAEDTWLALGSPAADPEFGVAMGRSWRSEEHTSELQS